MFIGCGVRCDKNAIGRTHIVLCPKVTIVYGTVYVNRCHQNPSLIIITLDVPIKYHSPVTRLYAEISGISVPRHPLTPLETPKWRVTGFGKVSQPGGAVLHRQPPKGNDLQRFQETQ